MPKISGDPERVVVTLTPEEIIHRPYFIQDKSGEKPHSTGDLIGDAIRRLAWRLVWTIAARQIAGRVFRYGDVEVVDGKFVVSFYNNPISVPNEPGAP